MRQRLRTAFDGAVFLMFMLAVFVIAGILTGAIK